MIFLKWHFQSSFNKKKGALWRFLVNKTHLCLHSAFLARRRCVSLRPNKCVECVLVLVKHLEKSKKDSGVLIE